MQIVATVSANQIAALAGINTAATGDVFFVDENGAALGVKPLVNGVATLSKAHWPAGAYQVRAFYGGDVTDAASSSPLVATRLINGRRRRR